jgi:hypothetical protein
MLALTGASMRLKVEPDQTTSVIYEQDVDAILAGNQAECNERAASHFKKTGDLMRVASVPEVVVYLWKKLYGFDLLKFHPNNSHDQAMLKRLLNDNDWLKLRTSPGVY